MSEILVNRFDTAAPVDFTLNKDGGVTGATIVVAVRDGPTSNSWLDFADLTFKTVGWTTRQATLAEVSAANAPGVYELAGGLNIAGITNLPVITDVLLLEFDVTAGGSGNVTDRMKILPVDLAVYNLGEVTAIHLDTAASNTGTIFGIDGSVQNPVSTVAAANTLLAASGINALWVRSGFVALSGNYDNMTIWGDHQLVIVDVTAITALGGADRLRFRNLAVFGTFPSGGGAPEFRNCTILQLVGAVGLFDDCLFDTSLAVNAGSAITIQDSVVRTAGGSPFPFDINGSSSVQKISDFSGDIQILNHTAGRLEIEIQGGQIELVASCTGGTARLSGVATLIDNSAGTVVDSASLLPSALGGGAGAGDNMSLYQGAIWIDPIGGSAGAVLGVNGTQGNPVIDDSDAATLATALGVREYRLISDTTLTAGLTNWTVSAREDSVAVNLGGQAFTSARFERCKVTGSFTGTVDVADGKVSAMTIDRMDARRTAFDGTNVLIASARLLMHDSEFSAPSGGPCVIDWGVGPNSATLRAFRCSGILEIDNFDDAGGSCDVDGSALDVTYRATCTAGTARLTGSGKVTNLGSGSFVLLDAGFVSQALVADATWDELTSAHGAAGTFGRAVNAIAEESTVAASPVPTTTSFGTGLDEVDGFWEGMLVLVIQASSGNAVARNIDVYVNTDGLITVGALPFTPTSGDAVLVVRRLGGAVVSSLIPSTT